MNNENEYRCALCGAFRGLSKWVIPLHCKWKRCPRHRNTCRKCYVMWKCNTRVVRWLRLDRWTSETASEDNRIISLFFVGWTMCVSVCLWVVAVAYRYGNTCSFFYSSYHKHAAHKWRYKYDPWSSLFSIVYLLLDILQSHLVWYFNPNKKK